jgi:hypothetical protein
MNLDTLIKLLDFGGDTASAARKARGAAEECGLALEGMRRAYPVRVEAGKMDEGEAGMKIWSMGHAVDICHAVADALDRRVENEKTGLPELAAGSGLQKLTTWEAG